MINKKKALDIGNAVRIDSAIINDVTFPSDESVGYIIELGPTHHRISIPKPRYIKGGGAYWDGASVKVWIRRDALTRVPQILEKDNPNEPDGKEGYYCKKEKYKQWGSKDPVSFL